MRRTGPLFPDLLTHPILYYSIPYIPTQICKRLGRVQAAMRHLVMALDLDPKDANLVKASPPASQSFLDLFCCLSLFWWAVRAHCCFFSFLLFLHSGVSMASTRTAGGHGAAGRGGGRGGGAGPLMSGWEEEGGR